MQTLTYTFIDKSTWGDGPWQAEVDKIQWADAATGLPCLAVRHPRSGHWCGYVGVDEQHPYFGKNANDLDVDCHDGLTFSNTCQEDERGVCHVVEPGEHDTVWWLGFDYAHSGDFSPGMQACRAGLGSPFEIFGQRDHYWTLPEVQAECARVAEQLKALE